MHGNGYKPAGEGKDWETSFKIGDIDDMTNYVPFKSGRIIALNFMGGKLYTQKQRITPPSGNSWVDVIEELEEVGGQHETFAMKVYPCTPRGSTKYKYVFEIQKNIYYLLGAESGGHRNILQLGSCYYDDDMVVEVGSNEIAGAAIYVFEFVPSRTHAAHINSARGYTTTESLGMIKALADLLQSMDIMGIAHRDIKLQNILVPADVSNGNVTRVYSDRLKLFDFDVGWSKPLEEEGFYRQMFTGSVVGTPGCIAPEAMSGASEAFEPAVDRYALGIVSLSLLTGNNDPWGFGKIGSYEALAKTIGAFKRDELPDGMKLLEKTVPDKTLRAGARELVEGLLRKDPLRRFEPDKVLELCGSLIDDARRADSAYFGMIDITADDVEGFEKSRETIAAGELDIDQLSRKLTEIGELRSTVMMSSDEARTIQMRL